MDSRMTSAFKSPAVGICLLILLQGGCVTTKSETLPLIECGVSGPATASVGKSVTLSVLVAYTSGCETLRTLNAAEDDSRKVVEISGEKLRPSLACTGSIVTNRATVSFVPQSSGTYQIDLANYQPGYCEAGAGPASVSIPVSD